MFVNVNELIGKRVMRVSSNAVGEIIGCNDSILTVSFLGETVQYLYPECFYKNLVLEDIAIQDDISDDAAKAAFKSFVNEYTSAVNEEISFLKSGNAKKYKVVDGERISSAFEAYTYVFDTDSELHFPDDTAIKINIGEEVINGSIVGCEEFTVTIQISRDLGAKVEALEFTANQWMLLERLNERIGEMSFNTNPIAVDIACNGRNKIDKNSMIIQGHSNALGKALSEKITFIWGPPGTGKTHCLSNIAVEQINRGKRVLMLSYSNVSVDGAVERVHDNSAFPEGVVIRYGYPRSQRLLDSDSLTSYRYVLKQNPGLHSEYLKLIEEKKKTKNKSEERLKINRRLTQIRDELLKLEHELVQKSAFVATTVSKAVVDKAIYSQMFDVVIFDEASMAYVPQIVYASGLAKSHFVCLGDFRQLPAIVQNNFSRTLKQDIFEFTGITAAVEDGYGHDWLVMLTEQHRMHPDIAEFVSRNMYNNLLTTAENIYESRIEIAKMQPNSRHAISLVDLSGEYSVCISTMDKSRINILSAMISVYLAGNLSHADSVGIITPYSAQSRLVVAMLRDLQEKNRQYNNVACATVHQFQGSEKNIIIYDAVDCYRQAYPGVLLTRIQNDEANRLFNVALTRAKGKFIMVANSDYLFKKRISPKLLFTKELMNVEEEKAILSGYNIINDNTNAGIESAIYVDDREHSWKRFISDISKAKESISMDIPGYISDDGEDSIDELTKVLNLKFDEKIDITIRIPSNFTLPPDIMKYTTVSDYVTNPVTIIDKSITWYGQPLCDADFIVEGKGIPTKYYICSRIEGKFTARSIRAFLEM